MSGKKPDYFDFKRLLSGPLKKNQFTLDLAEASNQVLGREVEEKRRLLERSRDSVRARKGQILSQIEYLPEVGKPAYYVDSGEPLGLEPGTRIPKALVRRFISNSAPYNQTPLIDYFEVEFKWSGQMCRWLMPQNVTQERDLLIKNSVLIGFDFFSQELSDEDYGRLYETLSLYWEENGQEDLFIQYIGFIKNLRLDAVPLWSQDDGSDLITNLQPYNSATMQKASEGGDWYLTSHVELRYDLSQFNNFYELKVSEIEALFYYFAPIILVLERIIGALTIETPVAILSATDFTSFHKDFGELEHDFENPFYKHLNTTHQTSIYGDSFQLSNTHYNVKNRISTFGTTSIYQDQVSLETYDPTDPRTTIQFRLKTSVSLLQQHIDFYDAFNAGGQLGEPLVNPFTFETSISTVCYHMGIIETTV